METLFSLLKLLVWLVGALRPGPPRRADPSRFPSPPTRVGQPHPRRRRGPRVALLAGNLLLALGVALFLAVGALYAYGAYERYRFEQSVQTLYAQSEALEVAEAGEEIAAQPAPAVEAVPSASPDDPAGGLPAEPAAESAAEPSPAERDVPPPTPTATPAPTPTPQPRPPRRIMIPRIEVNSLVVQAKVEDGEWKVPKFVAGHLQGTALPGQGSNVVLSGHVESISSGNVFARLGELEIGDAVTIVTSNREIEYTVAEIVVVKNTDLSVVAPTEEETLTLITCTGNWMPLARDYDRRLVVTAKPVPASPPPERPKATGYDRS